MEHGSSPTSYPGRTPIQIVGRLLFSSITCEVIFRVRPAPWPPRPAPFVVAALASAQIREVMNKLDRRDPFHQNPSSTLGASFEIRIGVCEVVTMSLRFVKSSVP